jgi:hypothetical protein
MSIRTYFFGENADTFCERKAELEATLELAREASPKMWVPSSAFTPAIKVSTDLKHVHAHEEKVAALIDELFPVNGTLSRRISRAAARCGMF